MKPMKVPGYTVVAEDADGLDFVAFHGTPKLLNAHQHLSDAIDLRDSLEAIGISSRVCRSEITILEEIQAE